MNLRRIAGGGYVASVFLLLVCISALLIILTLQYTPSPYSILFVGIEVALALMIGFSMIKNVTYKPTRKYDFDELMKVKEPYKLLLGKLNNDIGTYQEGSSYYYRRVRRYKYSTIVLGGVSTIILGLDLSEFSGITFLGSMTYTTFAKNVALVIGAIITVNTALMTYWNLEKYWLINKSILNKLKVLRDDIESDFVSGLLDQKKLQQRIDEYKNIKNEFYKYWEGALSERSSQGGQGNG